MRSLYTDDIKGTRSKVTIFQKSRFTQKYKQFVKSSQKNPQHKKYEWYEPVKKPQKNQNTEYSQPRYTLKLMSEHTGLSRSGHFEQLKKVQNSQSLNKKETPRSSLLSHSGRNSIDQINRKKSVQNNPYFPHRLVSDYSDTKARWTGNRSWNYDRPEGVQLPNITKSKLVSYF